MSGIGVHINHGVDKQNVTGKRYKIIISSAFQPFRSTFKVELNPIPPRNEHFGKGASRDYLRVDNCL